VVLRISDIEISTICHATEDIEKVKTALMKFIPQELRTNARVEHLQAKGYYKNPITRLVVRFRGKEAEKVAKYIFSLIDSSERTILLTTLDNRFDTRASKLYIRFSKQDAYLGSAVLFDGDDVIRVVMTLCRIKNFEDARKVLKELMEAEERIK